jgi:hypothetical protein
MQKAFLTVKSKESVIGLANKLHGLLIEHGKVDEASAALKLATTFWNTMPFESAEQAQTWAQTDFDISV